MTQINEISQEDIDAWPDSGTATTVTTGLDGLTGTVVHAEDTSIPVGQPGRKYLSFTEGVAATVRIDPEGTSFTDDDDYWMRFRIRANKTGSLGSSFLQMQRMGPGGTIFWMKWYAVEDDVNLKNGLYALAQTNSLGGTFKNHGLQSTSTVFSKPVMKFNTWYDAWFRAKHNTNGIYEVYINGMLNTGTYNANTGSLAIVDVDRFNLELPGITGIQWDVTGPFETWKGTDVSIRPQFDQYPANSNTTKIFSHHWREDISNKNGKFFDVSGTATIIGENYDPGFGVSPHRLNASGSSGETMIADTIEIVGTLPYNENGWATIVYDSIYLPDGSTMDLKIRNIADDADILNFTVDASRVLKVGTQTLKTLENGSVYSLLIHFNSNGTAYYTLVDLVKRFNAGQTIFSGQITGGWTAQDIGKLKASFVLGTSTLDFGPIQICKWWQTQLVDSQVASDSPTYTPAKNTPNRTGSAVPNIGEVFGIPNGFYRQHPSLDALDDGLNMTNIIIGNAGIGYTPFVTNNIDTDGMDGCRGGIFQLIDGYSTHETSGLISNETQRDSVVAVATTHIQKLIDTLTPNSNKLVLGTMHRRNYTTPPEFEHQAVNMINEMIREKSISEQTADNMIELADYAKFTGVHEDQFPVDDVHYNSTGSAKLIDILYNKKTIPVRREFVTVNPASVPSDGSSISVPGALVSKDRAR